MEGFGGVFSLGAITTGSDTHVVASYIDRAPAQGYPRLKTREALFTVMRSFGRVCDLSAAYFGATGSRCPQEDLRVE